MVTYALVGHVKSLTYETKSLHSPMWATRTQFMGRPKLDVSGLIDSNADLSLY